MTIDWQAYHADDLWDELVTPGGQPRPGAGRLLKALTELSNDEIRERKTAAELAIRAMGITFTVYDDGAHIDREWPFDIVPRLILKREWDEVARGLKQRVRALNAFIDDVYHHRRALRDGVVPADYVLKSRGVPIPVCRDQPAAWRLGPRLRQRPGPRRRRQALRPGGQPARAKRRLVHAREPRRDEARLPGTLRALRHPPGGRLPGAPGRMPALPLAARRSLAAHRRADPRHLQFGVLRARVPRSGNGGGPRRRSGPRRRR